MLRKIITIFFITSLFFAAHARFMHVRGKTSFLQAISQEPLAVVCFYQCDKYCKNNIDKHNYERLKTMMNIASKNHKFHYAQVAFMMVLIDQSFCDIISLVSLPSLMIFVDGQPYTKNTQLNCPQSSIQITQFVDQAIGSLVDQAAQQKLCYQEQLRLQAIAAWGFYGPWYYRPYWYGAYCPAQRRCW